MKEGSLDNNHNPLSLKTMILYGLPHLTHAVVVLPMALYIPSFYADDLALPLASVGVVIAVSRLLDVFTDPLIGVMSDRLRTRWGRRKPWLVAGTPLLMLSTWMIFVPNGNVSVQYLLLWTCLLFFGYTLVDLPYKAWGAELSTEYSERSRVTAWREGLGGAGQVMFLSMLLVMGLFGYHESHDQLLAIALTIVITVPILMAVTVIKVPERLPVKMSNSDLRGWPSIRLVFQNRAFLRTIFAIVLYGTGLLIQATLHRMVLTHVVGRPDLFAPMILLEHIGALIAVPFWMRISDRLGKHRAVTLAGLWVGLWSLALPLVGEGDVVLYVSLIVLRGSSFTSIFFLSNSIAADVVDYDTVESGQQRTGLYFSIWGMAGKASVALGVLLGTVIPASLGFEPSASSHSETALFSLMAVYGWLPFIIMVLAMPLLWNFPINRERQHELRAKIQTHHKR